MLPRPVTRTLRGFADVAVCVHVRVDQRHVSLVGFGCLIHESEQTRTASHTHNNHVDLSRRLVNVARKLLRHVKERYNYVDTEAKRHDSAARKQSAKTGVADFVNEEDTADRRTNNVKDITDIHYDRS